MPLTAQQIQQVYQDTLGREADEAGLNFYLNNPDATIEGLTQDIMGSPEGQVAQSYLQAFGRFPDDEGRQFYSDQLAAGTPIGDIQAALSASPEAQQVAAARTTGPCAPLPA